MQLDIGKPNQLPSKQYSLIPDTLAKGVNKIKPFRKLGLTFENRFDRKVVQQLTQFNSPHPQRIVFLGPRYSIAHQLIKKHSYKQYQRRVLRPNLYQQQQIVRFNYIHQKVRLRQQQRVIVQRIFTGMNPSLDPDDVLHFQSDFQCGNLDIVVKVKSNLYDLFMRVDSNSKGHCNWYFFTVRNCKQKQTVHFRICNFDKKHSLYGQGLRPYVFSRIDNQNGWRQSCQNISYHQGYLYYTHKQIKAKNILQFDYTFVHDYDQVSFAYNPPYSYSKTTSLIQSLKEKSKSFPNRILTVQSLTQSLGGLDIPLLTISKRGNKPKKTVFIISRLHPGQTQGSFIMEGFLNFLLSQSIQVQTLLQNTKFKIVPMMNPDGVICGNYRCSFSGHDLNRQFDDQIQNLFPQIQGLKNAISDIIRAKEQIQCFLDFHGHSLKKNVFIYGPQYHVYQQQYYACRLLPKLIGYYGCIFKISDFKRSTARAVMQAQFKIPFSYTVQASAYAYYDKDLLQTKALNSLMIMQIGKSIGEAYSKFVQRIRFKDWNVTDKIVGRVRKKQYTNKNIKEINKKQKNKNKKITQKDDVNYLFQDIKAQITIAQQRAVQQKLKQIQQGSSDCQSASQDYSMQQVMQHLGLKNKQNHFKKLEILEKKQQKNRYSIKARVSSCKRNLQKQSLIDDQNSIQRKVTDFLSIKRISYKDQQARQKLPKVHSKPRQLNIKRKRIKSKKQVIQFKDSGLFSSNKKIKQFSDRSLRAQTLIAMLAQNQNRKLRHRPFELYELIGLL